MRRGPNLLPLAVLALLAAPATAHPVPPVVTELTFPSGLPWDALKPQSGGNPFGYDATIQPGAWPVSLSVGDIDGDGRKDYLLCMEQRLLLAVGMDVDAQGVPMSPYVIWAWFDPNGPYFKHGWSTDGACIHDFDGDGVNEVAAVVGADPSAPGSLASSFRFVLLGGTLAPDPAFGNLPRPEILASEYVDAVQPGWTGVMLGTQGKNPHVQAFDDDPTDDAAREIFVHDTGSGMFMIVRYVPGSPGSFQLLQTQGYQGQSGHAPQPFDLDGDGYDELAMDGFKDFHPVCSFDLGALGFFASCSTQYNHADMIQPLDRDQDGQPELLVAHDCYDFYIQASPTLCTPVVPTLNSDPIAVHGQDLCVGRFLPGPDEFGYDGRSYVATPKGCPIWNGGSWGSYTMNGNGDRLAANKTNTSLPNGPNGWTPRNIDFDGQRARDEVLSKLGSRLSVWQLVNTPQAPPTHNSCFPPPQPDMPYSWTEISFVETNIHSGHDAWHAADVYGDYREELIAFGRNGVSFAASAHPVPQVPRYLTPFASTEYARRHVGLPHRTVDYQVLPKLERIEVRPNTVARAVGQSVTYEAVGHYVGAGGTDVEVDLTSFATFTSGDPSVASFSGNVLTAQSLGLAVLNCHVDGVPQQDVPMALVTDDLLARVLYAGFPGTFLSASAGPSDLVASARVADRNQNVLDVVFGVVGGGSLAGATPANDSGVNGDPVAGDGNWTLFVPGFVPGAPHDDDVTAQPRESLQPVQIGTLPSTWPYLRVGSSSSVIASGLPNPFESELYGPPPWPKLEAVGIWPASVASGTSSVTIRMFARVKDPTVTSIGVMAGGQVLAAGMNDQGTGADAFAGDGLWTGSFTATNLPDGRYLIDFVPSTAVPGQVGDASPRLRHHH